MKIKLSLLACAISMLIVVSCIVHPTDTMASVNISVDVNKPGITISPSLYGLMTEEINHSYDGGLYAELLQNRSFKDNAENPVHWSLVYDGDAKGSISLSKEKPLNESQPVSLKLNIDALTNGRVGIANDGYWGIPVKPNTSYHLRFYARADGDFKGPLTAAIVSNDNKTVYAKAVIPSITTEWKRYEAVLKTGNAVPSVNNHFTLYANGVVNEKMPTQPSLSKSESVYFSLVSLFPPTYKNRPNGLRIDLMEKMAAMKPAFLRFPGGNYLEGNKIAERFEWKKTIGDIADRPGHQGCWGYRSSDGLGLLEYLGWCEDLNMEPVLAVYAGYSLQGEYIKPGPDLEPYVQDALDEIEYVTGDAKTTHWGVVRAANGHPKPFKLRYVEIGNEDGFDRSGSYRGRYTQFYNAIKAKYPHLQLIATVGSINYPKVDMIDDHYYRNENGMIRDIGHYDKYDRKGPKVFVGEWATTVGSPTPTLHASIADAVWILGMERNSDIIPISCYAPLLVNVNPWASQWGTNLIGYNALNSFGSPSYYIQAMFANNKGDKLLPVTITKPTDILWKPHGTVGVGTWRTLAEYKDIEVINDKDQSILLKNTFDNLDAVWKSLRGIWSLENGVYTQSSLEDDCVSVAGDTSWTNYTYKLKARKTGGEEGFLIPFHYIDNDNYLELNLGGWKNTRSVIMARRDGSTDEICQSPKITIDSNRWYDIRIDIRDGKISCYLDNALIMTAKEPGPSTACPVYSNAVRDLKTGDVIIKLVNTDKTSQSLSINLAGVKSISDTASVEYINGQPGDMNTKDDPNHIVPHHRTVDINGHSIDYSAPANSVSVIRVNVKQ